MPRKWDDMEGRWEDEGGGNPPEDDYDEDHDREPRVPLDPNKSGGVSLPIPEPEEELVSV